MYVKIGRPLQQVITLAYQANQPVMLMGSHGVGKSESLKESAKNLGIDIRIMDLSIMEATDLAGIPAIENRRTVFYPPADLPTEGSGLLVLEELNRASAHLRAPALQLLTERRLNGFRLKNGWLPVASANPPTDDYEVEEIDLALKSRFMILNVVADRDEWIHWAEEHGVHKRVIGFVEASPEIFAEGDKTSNPRAWTYVSSVLKVHEDKPIVDIDHLTLAISGMVGEKWAVSFMRYFQCDTNFNLTPSDILDSFATHQCQLSSWKKGGGRHVDMLRGMWYRLENFLQKQANLKIFRENPTWQKNLASFLSLLPKDIEQEAWVWLQEKGILTP